jgi:hypothetical protein
MVGYSAPKRRYGGSSHRVFVQFVRFAFRSSKHPPVRTWCLCFNPSIPHCEYKLVNHIWARLIGSLASFAGEFASQNAVLAERFIEKGGPYVLDVEDADVYRIPYLDSSDAGFGE